MIERDSGKGVVELSEGELAEITGGLKFVHVKSTDKYYKWRGGSSHDGQKYFCPNCGRPVHYGAGLRYYCDPCDASWLHEWRLVPNVESGFWKEITKREYDLGLDSNDCR